MTVSASAQLPNHRVDPVVIKVTGSASYTTGGDALAAGTIPSGNSFIGIAQAIPGPAANGDRLYYWDNDAQKLVAHDALGTQEGSGTDVSADVIFLFGFIV